LRNWRRLMEWGFGSLMVILSSETP